MLTHTTMDYTLYEINKRLNIIINHYNTLRLQQQINIISIMASFLEHRNSAEMRDLP